jgi:thiol-disulfide isomerase/thioredoxin
VTSSSSSTTLLLYFSASWCPPCKAFTPNLVKYYDHVNREGKKVEIIMIPCEARAGDDVAYAERYNMKWLMMDTVNNVTHSDAVKTIYGIWAGPRDGHVLGNGAHGGIPQLIEVDRETGQPLHNYRQFVNEYVQKHHL